MPESPCLDCTSDADCPCLPRLAWEGAQRALWETTQPECLTCADALWLLREGRERFERVAERLGLERTSLARHLRRHGVNPRAHLVEGDVLVPHR